MPFRRGSVVPSADRGENRAFHRMRVWTPATHRRRLEASSVSGNCWVGVSYSLCFDKWFCLTWQSSLASGNTTGVRLCFPFCSRMTSLYCYQVVGFQLIAKLFWNHFKWVEALASNRGTGLTGVRNSLVPYFQKYFLILGWTR